MNMNRISKNRWITGGVLLAVFFLLNHCGLQAAMHQSQPEKKMSCHQTADSGSSQKSSCDDECCTKLRATAKESVRLEMPQDFSEWNRSVDFSASLKGEVIPRQSEWFDSGPPHLSFKTLFSVEAFLSHAPPF